MIYLPINISNTTCNWILVTMTSSSNKRLTCPMNSISTRVGLARRPDSSSQRYSIWKGAWFPHIWWAYAQPKVKVFERWECSSCIVELEHPISLVARDSQFIGSFFYFLSLQTFLVEWFNLLFKSNKTVYREEKKRWCCGIIINLSYMCRIYQMKKRLGSTNFIHNKWK